MGRDWAQATHSRSPSRAATVWGCHCNVAYWRSRRGGSDRRVSALQLHSSSIGAAKTTRDKRGRVLDPGPDHLPSGKRIAQFVLCHGAAAAPKTGRPAWQARVTEKDLTVLSGPFFYRLGIGPQGSACLASLGCWRSRRGRWCKNPCPRTETRVLTGAAALVAGDQDRLRYIALRSRRRDPGSQFWLTARKVLRGRTCGRECIGLVY